MAGVIQFSGGAQPTAVSIQQAGAVVVCRNSAAAKHVQERFPFDESSVAFVSDTDPLLRQARQDAEVYFVANGGGRAAGQEFADRFGRPILCVTGEVDKLDGTGLEKAFEAAQEIKPGAKAGTRPATAPVRASPELPVDRLLRDASEEGTPQTPLPPIVSADELCASPPPTPPEIIEGVLHQGSKMALGGGSKSFKTWTLTHLAICVATGCDWLGFPTRKGKVLYINFELPEFSMEKRIREIRDAMGLPDTGGNLMIWNLRGHATDAATILPTISREAKRHGFSLIIIDPLYKLLGARDENSSRDMANLMNAVERLAVETAAAVVFGSHYSKGNQAAKESMDRISGSGVFARDPDSIITMTAHEQPGAFSVEMTLRNFPPQDPFVVRRQHPLMVIDGQLDPTKLKQVRGRTPKHQPDDLLKALVDGMTDKEWKAAAAECGIARATYYELKRELLKSGKVFHSELDQRWSRK